MSDLYQQMIVEHNRNPRNFREIDPCSRKAEGFNPVCGDHLWVYVKLNGSGKVDDVAFQGDGCAIAKASASIMTEEARGKTAADVEAMIEDFLALLAEGKGEVSRRLQCFSSVHRYPARVKCANLAWHALRSALATNHSGAVSTE